MTNGNFLLGVANGANAETSLGINIGVNTNVNTLHLRSAPYDSSTGSRPTGQAVLAVFNQGVDQQQPNGTWLRSYAVTVVSEVSTCIDAIVLGSIGNFPSTTAIRGEVQRREDIGVHGRNSGAGLGVFGDSVGAPSGSRGGTGVYGACLDVGGKGVYGIGDDTGVHGSALSNGAGVYGESSSGVGVQGFSLGGTGLYANGSLGLVALGTAGIAARFNGDVFIENGNLTVFGGTKSAAVPHPDGSHRQLYVLESPEGWFEDFGQAFIQDGRADVDIDPEFGVLIRADDYHVFLTPYGECNGLYVSDRKTTGFTVRELQQGTSTVEFGYRILARRKDTQAERLKRVELPELPTLREPSEFTRPHPLDPDLPAQK